ncbi:MAG TPA: hypothetical protein VGY76_14340 [Solirubrobacteraceae bacterium]|nr:hypothetical protein [Solirubrobacteraceae bacterium]
MPTNCQSGGLGMALFADSWQNPLVSSLNLEEGFARKLPEVVHEEAFNHDSKGRPVGVSGCDRLDFSPTVNAQTDTPAGGSPSGISVEVSLPQSESPAGLGEADLRKAVASLPAAMAVSPSAATGLQGCTVEQIALSSEGPANCPDTSKIGTVEIGTPLLEKPLEGFVYVAQPNQNKFNSLLALYVVAEGSGIVIKLAGKIQADESTGQLTTMFEETPQAPFAHLHLKLFGGPRAPLATPRRCGSYDVTGALTPWSSLLPVTFSYPIVVSSNCGGRFSPSFVAGTLSNHAGGFSPFTLTLTRSDQDQGFERLSVRTPPGLLGMLSKIQLCEEPQIAQQACPPASQVGHVTVAAGAGPEPVYLPEPGRPEDPVYLTTGYNGAPFGLLTLVHAEAGPFNLGIVPVRATINVDRRTSQIVATTNPLPTIVKGIPVDVKAINLLLDREGFTFNPTDCEPLKFEGLVQGDEGAIAPVSSPFQAADCASLGFKPSFTAATAAKSSKAKGASLEVKVAYAKGAQANIAAVRVQLPKQLPSRLTTIQQACPEATFAANPATCSPGSLVGIATATTPVLNMPVTGPAYLVSHGGAAFPDLVMILQGQGVTVELIGNTNIKSGVTTSTFASVPDVPISTFDVKLPQGPHSALTSNLPAKRNGNFCSSKLVMPTALVAQNGLRIKQSTRINVTGCPKVKRAKAQAKKRK